MARKPLHHPRRGSGAFPVAGVSPTLAVAQMIPLHSSDQWEELGRPFWCVRYPVGRTRRPGKDDGYIYARTMTPTYCPLAVVLVPPPDACGAYVGACGEWLPADWSESKSLRSALSTVRRYEWANPIQVTHYDRMLWEHSVQRYAAPGDIRSSAPVPVERSQSLWQPPAPAPLPTPDASVLLDDGCPHTREDE